MWESPTKISEAVYNRKHYFFRKRSQNVILSFDGFELHALKTKSLIPFQLPSYHTKTD